MYLSKAAASGLTDFPNFSLLVTNSQCFDPFGHRSASSISTLRRVFSFWEWNFINNIFIFTSGSLMCYPFFSVVCLTCMSNVAPISNFVSFRYVFPHSLVNKNWLSLCSKYMKSWSMSDFIFSSFWPECVSGRFINNIIVLRKSRTLFSFLKLINQKR